MDDRDKYTKEQNVSIFGFKLLQMKMCFPPATHFFLEQPILTVRKTNIHDWFVTTPTPTIHWLILIITFKKTEKIIIAKKKFHPLQWPEWVCYAWSADHKRAVVRPPESPIPSLGDVRWKRHELGFSFDQDFARNLHYSSTILLHMFVGRHTAILG